MGDSRPRSKLPVKQLAILAVARFAEPLALTSVFPYLPEMIASFGVDKDSIAKWAGLTGATFSVCQSLFAVPWGLVSDRIGRKPTILFGLVSTMICFIIWGMSTSLAMAMTIRAIQGASNGNVGIIRTMVAEMVTDKEHQPRAFSIMPLVWSIGSVFGPAFGGFFARPAEQFPSLFGHIEFFKHYPFALPNIIACFFFLVSVITGTLFLKETLASKRDTEDWGLKLGEKLTRPFKSRKRPQHRPSFVDGEATAPLLPRPAAAEPANSSTASQSKAKIRDIFTYSTVMNLICYTFLAMHSVAFDQLLPVFLHHPHQKSTPENTSLPFRFSSGFGLSSDKIGAIFMIYGIVCGLIQFIMFPPLCNYFGVLKCYRAAALMFPVCYFLTPFTSLVHGTYGRYIALMFIMLLKGFAVIIGFPCLTIMLTNSASSLSILGTLNGIATTTSGFGRAVGPAAAGAIFSWGIQRGYVISGWWFLGAVAVVGAIPPFFITEGSGPYADAQGDETDVDEGDAVAEADPIPIPESTAGPLGPHEAGFPSPPVLSESSRLRGRSLPKSYGTTH
ncbi:hypothetical protein MCOR25_005079 [Pyricularia grisea]|nr:hypothetical protein MCOR25_005079 [Pyricularia grisea]